LAEKGFHRALKRGVIVTYAAKKKGCVRGERLRARLDWKGEGDQESTAVAAVGLRKCRYQSPTSLGEKEGTEGESVGGIEHNSLTYSESGAVLRVAGRTGTDALYDSWPRSMEGKKKTGKRTRVKNKRS